MALTNQAKNTATVVNQSNSSFQFSRLLMETGDTLLLEDGFDVLLELAGAFITTVSNQIKNTGTLTNQVKHNG